MVYYLGGKEKYLGYEFGGQSGATVTIDYIYSLHPAPKRPPTENIVDINFCIYPDISLLIT